MEFSHTRRPYILLVALLYSCNVPTSTAMLPGLDAKHHVWENMTNSWYNLPWNSRALFIFDLGSLIRFTSAGWFRGIPMVPSTSHLLVQVSRANHSSLMATICLIKTYNLKKNLSNHTNSKTYNDQRRTHVN